jgi:hypothetical protein
VKKLGVFLLAKDANAIVVAFLCALLPVFSIPTGFIAAIIVGLVTLQKGPKSGFWLLAWVALPTIALLVLRQVGQFDVLFVRCVVVWIFASLFYRYQTWRLLLELMAYTGIVLIAILHFCVPHIEQWWIKELTTFIQQLTAASHWKIAITPAEFAQRLAPLASGVVLFFFFSSLLVELFFARFWQSLIVNPGSFANEFTQIRIGKTAAIVFSCLLIAFVFFKVRMIEDAFPIMLLPFFIAGLSVLHFWVRRNNKLVVWLILMYVVLFFVPAFAVSVLALIAFIETWRNFRKNKLEQCVLNAKGSASANDRAL